MSDLGDMLRATREKRGLTIPEIAIETRIRGKLIVALEAGDYQQLPPEPFVRGLLKNYARVLGLEPDLVLDAFAIETGTKAAPGPPSVQPIPGPEGITPVQNEPPPPAQPPEIFVLPPAFLRRDGANEIADNGHDVGPLTNRAGPAAVQQQPEDVRTRQTSQYPQESAAPFDRVSPKGGSQLQPAPPPQPTFQVAPESQPEPATLPDRSVWIHRIGASRAPEIIAAVAVAVAVIGVAAFGYTRLFVSSKAVSQAAPVITTTPIAVANRVTTAMPTPVPTFEATAARIIRPSPAATKAAADSPTLVDAPVAGQAQMEIQISATDSSVWAWVVADNVEVFKGNIQNETKTWDAHERLYIQVKDLPNGTITFEGKPILARVFAERTLLERSWQMNSQGTPEAVEASPFIPTPSPAITQTTASPNVNQPAATLTQPPAPVATESPTPGANISATATPTASSSETPAGSASSRNVTLE